MLRLSEGSVKACDITTAAALGDSTSIEPMERITETGKAKAQSEEDITMNADSFDSDTDEEDDPRDQSYELRTSQTFVAASYTRALMIL